MKQSNLDEMQEQKLLKIEHNACWLGFWALLASILIQLFCFRSLKMIAGEALIFFGLCFYILIDCLRNGIWDRRMKAEPKTNFLASVLAAAAVFLFDLALCLTLKMSARNALLYGLFAGLLTFALTFGLLTLCTSIYKKRRKALEQE